MLGIVRRALRGAAIAAAAAAGLLTSGVKANAEQFVLFDVTFTFTKADADNSTPNKSHYYVKGALINPKRPADWTKPVDYRNGTVHIRTEVLDKPEGDEPTQWSLCYIPNHGQGNGYGCTGTDIYTKKGVYEKDVAMTSFWENNSIIWSEGIKQMDLVIKDKNNIHAHKSATPEKFFPTRIRITMVQVSAGAKYNPDLVPNIPHSPKAVEAAHKLLPDPAQLSKLDVEASILGFAVRVPKDYELSAAVDDKVHAITFTALGPSRADKSRPGLTLSLVKPPAAEQKNITQKFAVSTEIDSLKAIRSPIAISPIQTGDINGISYSYATWTGTAKSSNKIQSGEFYVARNRDLVIVMRCLDMTKTADTTIPLMDACLRTFRKVSQKLYYSMQWPDHSQIWSMDPDGSHSVCLTPKTDTDYHPAVSPDGKSIAFTTHRTGVRSIWTMDADGSNQRPITKDADAGQCTWSPMGDRLAFSSNRSGRYCIYTMKADGTDVKKISDGPSDDWPSWGADETIVYEAKDSSNWTIKTAQADGTGKPKALTDGMAHARWPSASADGSAILYTAYVDNTGRQSHINLMMSDGTMKTPLTNGANNEREPSWTADGGQILFHSDRQGRYEVYVMESDVLQPRRLAEANMDTREITTAGREYVP